MTTSIKLSNVYKIFGARPKGRALTMAKTGVGKDDVQLATDHVIGLHDVSFEVADGEVFVIMGLSGSGKSTAVRCVNRLHEVTDGSVMVDGVEVTELKKKELEAFRRDKIGMVFQHFALFPHCTVVDNVSYGLKVRGITTGERRKRAYEALEMVGLERYGQSYPRQLSGGMQQRVGLARALAADLDILLMDEAFSALDPLIRRQMQDELLSMQDEILHKTILFITHDLNEALRVGDRVCIMKDGAVVQIGTPEEILRDPSSAYVAEFVKDVDQGRVLHVGAVMVPPRPIRVSTPVSGVQAEIGAGEFRFCIDAGDHPVGLVSSEQLGLVVQQPVESVMSTDICTVAEGTPLVDIYEIISTGQPVAVVDDRGRLIGQVNALDLLAELGEIESKASQIQAAEASSVGGRS